MPRPRTSTVELARLLGETAEPIYVLDGDSHVVYCNRACAAWLGIAEEELLGQRAVYHSTDQALPAAIVAAGLAPPPQEPSAAHFTAIVASPHDRRQAHFVRLAGEHEPLGVAAFVACQALADDQPQTVPDAENTPAGLHDLLRRLRRQLADWHHVDRLLGQAAVMRHVRALVQVAAGCEASVLLVGPPGCGRQHVATTIHFGPGAEAAGPLVPLACAVLNADLLGSTLRAIAVRHHAEAPRPGTLLLGDVDQLSREAQAELAALLVGKPFPLRLMATSRTALAELVRRDEFREDLAVLLATLTIELPSLAERREDLPLLAQLFLEDCNLINSCAANDPAVRRFAHEVPAPMGHREFVGHTTPNKTGKQLAGFAPDALDLMDLYSWPGNLDELARVVSEAHAHSETALVRAVDLPQRLHLAADAAAHPRRKEEAIVLDEFLGQVERELIARALRRSKGNKAQAARRLGVTRPRLYRRMMQLGMQDDGDAS